MTFKAPPVKDELFLVNVAEARDNGYDLVCVDCGAGLVDESDMHDSFCPRHPDVEANYAAVAVWAINQKES